MTLAWPSTSIGADAEEAVVEAILAGENRVEKLGREPGERERARGRATEERKGRDRDAVGRREGRRSREAIMRRLLLKLDDKTEGVEKQVRAPRRRSS
jgi:hypothetical protein